LANRKTAILERPSLGRWERGHVAFMKIVLLKEKPMVCGQQHIAAIDVRDLFNDQL
jgi:hypothetical protein